MLGTNNANTRPPLDLQGGCSAVAEGVGGRGGSRAQLELIDALMNFSIDS